MSNSDSFWGPVFFSYTRAQAIEDGVLVNLNAVAPEICRQHFKYPVACTAEVWAIIDAAVKNQKYCNDLVGVLHDIFHMSKAAPTKRIDATQHLFQVIVKGAGRKSTYTFKVVCGPGDTAEPVLTFMLPSED